MLTDRLLPLLAATALASACVAPAAPPGVMVASDPPGARVYIDGRDSGWVTPAYLDLEQERQRIDVVLPGYVPATLVVAPGGERYHLILWQEAYIRYNTWRFPLWLNFEDGFAPVKLVRHLHPSRIFVPLQVDRQEG